MIEVIYRNRLGNRLFQYCFGRIVAEAMNWRLQCHPIDGFSGTREQVEGASFEVPRTKYGDRAISGISSLIADSSPRHIILRGWFQCYEYYRPYTKKIRRWLQPDPSLPHTYPRAGKNDLVLHFRLGKDYQSRKWIVHREFYEHVLDAAHHVNKIYICYDARERVSDFAKEQCLTPFIRRRAILVNLPTAKDDFNFVCQFPKIAIAPSTFCWWAAYLSDAEEIYFPDLRDSATSCWRSARDGKLPIRLEVDEPRYQYFKARTLWD